MSVFLEVTESEKGTVTPKSPLLGTRDLKVCTEVYTSIEVHCAELHEATARSTTCNGEYSHS